jgi:hypothetical protein
MIYETRPFAQGQPASADAEREYCLAVRRQSLNAHRRAGDDATADMLELRGIEIATFDDEQENDDLNHRLARMKRNFNE